MKYAIRSTILLVLLGAILATGQEDKAPAKPLTAAILPFQERGLNAKGLAATTADLLFAELAANPNLMLVDRADIEELLKEKVLSKSGLVNHEQAVTVGQLTGAKVLITGSVISAGKSQYIVVKVIGTETSRVLGESVKGNQDDEIDTLVETLAPKIATLLEKRNGDLVAKVKTRADRLDALKKALGKAERPSLYIAIDERHVGQRTIDPAAQTEVMLFATESGFKVVEDPTKADLVISGEGFSEFAMRRADLISVKARLELKVVDRSDSSVVAVDRQTTVEVDLVEQMAGKAALQEAAAMMAERLLPKLVKAPANKKNRKQRK